MRKRYSATFKAKVVQELMREEKTLAAIAAEYGVHPNMLRQWKRAAIEGLPRLFEDQSKAAAVVKAEHEREMEELYTEIGKLTTQLTWLKKNLVSTISRRERLMMIERDNPRMPLAVQAQLLSLSRSSLYYQPVQPTAEEIAIKHRIDEIYTQYPFYGSRRITQQLGCEGWLTNRKAVQRHTTRRKMVAPRDWV